MEETYCEDPEGSDASGATENQECDVNFTARPYQVELFEHAKKQNSILVLGTGSGKTFISILLIKELSDQIREPFSKGGKRTVFIVNTVPLVHQQALAIETHTALKVGKYEGSMGVDFWTAEMWKEELEKNEVLVFVAQIFLDLVLHASLPLSAVNLLIMDECHHTVGNHPMREIMRQYEGLKIQSPEKCPRIMGLTACVIHRKCRKSEVMDTMKKLEAAMDSALVTTTYQKEVVKCSTAPKEKVICYGTDEISEYQECIIAQLTGISEEVKERDDIQIKYKKLVRKKIINIINIMTTLGDWCVARAIKYEMDHFEDIKKIEDVPVVRELMTLLQNRLQEIYYICVVEETKMENPIDYVTKKVKRLFEIFRACNREVYGIIFVERRNTAKILYDLLLNVADTNEDLSFVKPLYVVGSNAYTGTDIRLAELELRKQRETLDKFCNGECNFIVSTSVLEEGVDIRKCNIVIRFDEPANYRAFVQSKGRARALPSRYLLMVNETKLQELKDSIDLYKEIEKALTLLCHDRQLPTLEEIRKHYVEDEYIEPYLPYGPDGAKVTLNSAISLINVYCGKLPQDKFTELTAEVVYTKYEEGVKAQIKLPMNAPLKVPVIGDCMVNKELAKKSAAIYLCKKLHHMGELDNRLRPAEVLDDSILEGLVEVPPEEALKDDAPDPGTKSRRQVYTKEVCSAFTHNYEGNYQLYSIVIHPKSNPPKNLIINSDKMDSTIGFICKGNLIHCPFPLYFSKWGEVEVRVEHIKELTNLGLELFYKIEHFHKLTVEMLLHINTSLFEFSSRDAGVFIVPVKEKNINLDILNRIMPLASLRSPVVNTTDSQSFYFERSNFEDAIIYPLYGPQPDQLFYVTQIMDDTNPHSEFPDSKKQYSSYAEYFLLKYELKITNIQQPLIAAKHLPKELKYLEIPAVPLKNNTGKVGRDPPRFLPEFCGVLPLKASLWWQIMCVPSIFYRLNSLNLAHQVNTLMNIAKYQIKAAEHTTVNFGWPEESVNRLLGPFGNNLAACLLRKKSNFIHPFMLVHALTLRGAHDGFDMERLEVLGDSFLKYITAEYLFLKDNKDHEGRLSLRRCKLVCNRTLYSLAKQRKLPEKIQAINLSPQTNGFLPGFSVKPMMDRKLRSWNIPHNKWSQLPLLDHPEDILEEVSNLWIRDAEDDVAATKKGGSCYNPWTQHELSDKSIADCVEALIGAYLLIGGSEAAINFLHKLGLGVYNKESLLKLKLEVPSPVMIEELWASDEISRLYKKACLDRLEDKIDYKFNDRSFIVQAVTHSSYSQNKVTDCYQRLEFLGDAVLDYLVTGFVFSRHAAYSPGQMSDLRSYYVKNETLATVAAEKELHKHLLYMAPKLSASIDKFLKILDAGYEEDTLTIEEDEMDYEDIDIPKALGDLIESIIGAVYLDSGRSLEITWRVVEQLMGTVIKKTVSDIPISSVRQLYEEMPGGVKFEKVPRMEGDLEAKYKVQIRGLPPLCGSGKNYRTAKSAAAKFGLQKLREAQTKNDQPLGQ